MPLALTLQILQLIYNQVGTLCDLYPFNAVRLTPRKDRLIESAINGLVMGFPIVAFLTHRQFWMEGGLTCLVVLALGEIFTWWVPYLFGASPKWAEMYARVHRHTLTPLPARGPNPVPNWEHLILMVITQSTTIVSLLAYRTRFGLSFPHWWLMLPIALALLTTIYLQCCYAPKPRTPLSE